MKKPILRKRKRELRNIIGANGENSEGLNKKAKNNASASSNQSYIANRYGSKRPDTKLKAPKYGKLSSLQEKFKSKLSSGQFRYLNEQLYTTTGKQALEMMKVEPDLYDAVCSVIFSILF